MSEFHVIFCKLTVAMAWSSSDDDAIRYFWFWRWCNVFT